MNHVAEWFEINKLETYIDNQWTINRNNNRKFVDKWEMNGFIPRRIKGIAKTIFRLNCNKKIAKKTQHSLARIAIRSTISKSLK